MDDLYWVGVFAIKDGGFEAFKSVVHSLVEAARQEPGVLAFEFSASPDGRKVQIIEHHATSADVIHHITKTFAKFGEPFMALASLESFTVYGEPDAEAKSILDGFGAVYLRRFDGFTR